MVMATLINSVLLLVDECKKTKDLVSARMLTIHHTSPTNTWKYN
jgi:hypothetical protein